jgi:hypothetical protein
MIERSSLSKRVKELSVGIFTSIGKAEAKIHGIKRFSDIAFHELGEIDSIVDIVGTAIACDEMGIDEVYASPVTMGRTVVDCAHGRLPIPGPAALELLRGAPVKLTDIAAELVTPTGAGILGALTKSFGACPEMTISRVGYGAGSKEFKDLPNMLRVVIGEKEAELGRDRIVSIEANIDDMNPQFFEYIFARLFDEGALDVYTSHIQMKKSRPAFKLTVLAEPAKAKRLADIILSETTSIGVRYFEMDRFKLDRKVVSVKTKYGNIRVKVSGVAGRPNTVSPEYDDCVKIARSKRVPLRKVYDEAKYLSY